MKKIVFLASVLVFLFFNKPTFAQMGMMGNYQVNPPSQNDLQNEQNEQNQGQKIYQNLQDKKVSCSNLTNDDFEKLGDYFMGQALGSTENHYYMDQRMTQMMGDSANTQMHVVWGERGSGCLTNTALPSNTPSFVGGMMNGFPVGGGVNMMGLGYGMMGGYSLFNILASIISLAILIDLILFGALLFKRIRK